MNLLKKISTILLILTSTQAIAADYIVQPGDSAIKIIIEQGFSGNSQELLYEVKSIVSTNPHAFRKNNPNRLIPGSRLMLPDYLPTPEVEPAPQKATLEEVGHIYIKQGTVNIIRNNEALDAHNDAELYSGDKLITSENTITQMKMLDGSLFELGPNTEFSLDKFILPDSTVKPGASPNEKSSLIDRTGQAITTLITGAARIVTGKIGQYDKSKFISRTSIASIGIRGTDYTVRYCETDCGQLTGTSVAVTDGGINLTNEAGMVELDKGEFARVEDAGIAPYSAPLPAGFFDLSVDATQIEVPKAGWWKSLIDTISSWF